MIIRRLAALGGVASVVGLVPALPAAAHGTPTTPVSRTAACASGGDRTGAAACRAARAANGGAFGAFDNLRVPNVDGRDRRLVPDGRLCSGGLAAYRGLDLARGDFPATTVTGGTSLAIRYRGTIPHAGTFRIYLTRPGYDPATKLRWADLTSRPIATVTDPPLRDGAYVMSARLPADRVGRHILFVVWQTSSTPDTYYSCSDLVFRKAAAPAAAKPSAPGNAATAGTTRAPGVGASAPSPAVASPAVASPAVASPAAGTRSGTAQAATTSAPPAARGPAFTPVSAHSRITLGHQIVAGALAVAAGVAAWAVIGAVRRRRRPHR